MSLISPRTGLNFVRTGLKKTLNQEIEDFDILYYHSPQKVDIRVYNFALTGGTKVFKYNEGDKLFSIINTMLKKELKPGSEIVKALISYSQMIVILTSSKIVMKQVTVFGETYLQPETITESKTIKL